MTDALAALGVAAGIAQFTSIGLQGAAFILETYNSADGLIDAHRDILLIAQNMKLHCKTLSAEPSSQIDANLRCMLGAARKLADALVAELEKLQRVSEHEHHLVRLRQVLRAVRKKSHIEETQRQLVEMRDGVQFALLEAMQQVPYRRHADHTN